MLLATRQRRVPVKSQHSQRDVELLRQVEKLQFDR